MNKHLKIILGSIAGVIVFAVLIIFGFNQLQQVQTHNAEVAAHKKAVAAEKKKEKQFNEVFPTFISDASDVGGQAETIGGKFYDVWQKTIENGSIKIAGDKYTDFNDALRIQSAIFDGNGDLDEIKTVYNNLKRDYKVLSQNVTKKNKEKFAQVKKLYNDLSEFYNLTTSPTGSLSSYSTDYNQLDSSIAAALKAIQ
jgi:hypothetical protein